LKVEKEGLKTMRGDGINNLSSFVDTFTVLNFACRKLYKLMCMDIQRRSPSACRR
jgi:hypothetical protein